MNTNDNKCIDDIDLKDVKDVIWISGEWRNRIWKDGIWIDGIWVDGTWIDGEWRDGIWKGGVWKNGVWRNGIWRNGTWKSGYWIKGFIVSTKFNKLVYSIVSPAEFYAIEEKVSSLKELIEKVSK